MVVLLLDWLITLVLSGCAVVVGVHGPFGGGADDHAPDATGNRADWARDCANRGACDAAHTSGRARVGVARLRGVDVFGVVRMDAFRFGAALSICFSLDGPPNRRVVFFVHDFFL
jgi:hypothetical protein